MDEGQLDFLEQIAKAKTTRTELEPWITVNPTPILELIRLARLGLWAERLGIPALKAIAPSWLPTNPRGLRRHALDHLPESTTASDGELPESDSQSHTPEEA